MIFRAVRTGFVRCSIVWPMPIFRKVTSSHFFCHDGIAAYVA